MACFAGIDTWRPVQPRSVDAALSTALPSRTIRHSAGSSADGATAIVCVMRRSCTTAADTLSPKIAAPDGFSMWSAATSVPFASVIASPVPVVFVSRAVGTPPDIVPRSFWRSYDLTDPLEEDSAVPTNILHFRRELSSLQRAVSRRRAATMSSSS